MKSKLLTLSLLLLCWFPQTSQADDRSRVQVGLNGGIFRISVDNFNEFYGNRVAYPVGGSIGYALSSSFHIMLRGKYFQKSSAKFSEQLARNLHREWQESWLGLGIQQYSTAFSGDIRTYFGFGLAFFFIQERKDGNFLSSEGYGGHSAEPKGFYICAGYERYLGDRVTVGFDIELSSAGVGKGSGLESQSIGGIYAGLGIN